jgi:uncharacterized protein with PhoU and TrkA domain
MTDEQLLEVVEAIEERLDRLEYKVFMRLWDSPKRVREDLEKIKKIQSRVKKVSR